jgi:hypothetical protein
MSKRASSQSPRIKAKKISNKNKQIIKISPFPRIIIIAILLYVFFLAGSHWWIEDVYAGTPDKFGNNAEIYSVDITPSSVLAGTYPEITGFVRNTSSLKNKNNGKALFDVIAVITYPNGSQKSWLWHDVNFTANQRKAYSCLKNYDMRQVGRYKVAYSVYNSGKNHLYTSLSKLFAVSNPPRAAMQVPSPKAVSKAPEAKKNLQPKKEPLPTSSTRLESQIQQVTASETNEPLPYNLHTETDLSGERQIFGVGAYLNTINLSGGPTIILWPFKNVAVQGTYGFGTFTSYEARTFYRFPLMQNLHPYIGAGYIHAEHSTHVLGVETNISGNSFTAFGGVELPITNILYGYIDISGTPIKLKNDGGPSQATATVKYSSVTVNMGLVFYRF